MARSPDTRSDDELVRAFRGGDDIALEALYYRHRGPVFTWLRALARDSAAAEDLLQDVWVKIVRGIGGYQGGNFKSWMWRIARNVAIDHARRRKDLTILDAPVGEGEGATSLAEMIPDDRAVDAIARLDAEERRIAVRSALAELSPPLREVMVLRLESDLKFREIAALMKLPLGTVLARMNSATRKMREILVGKGVENG
ncbi:MAG: sigma-70 family RNA polymerase sigma factor [Kiritimatiellae bacterium]|nr:sigma-70 family RNA polymerase sigma factor [Kiritimatiellia bacterium]